MSVAATHAALADQLQARLFEHFRAMGHDLESQPWEVGIRGGATADRSPVIQRVSNLWTATPS